MTQDQSPHGLGLLATATPGEARDATWVRLRTAATYQAFLFLVLSVLLYRHIFMKLLRDWRDIPDFSHGFIIPFFVIFLLWERRRALAATPVRTTWAGLPVVAFGLLLLVVGVLGADLFLSRISFLVVCAGAVWSLAGWQVLRKLGFVFFVALLAIPLPALVMNQLTFPLQLLASQCATLLLSLCNVPVLREGNVIQLPAMQLEVAEACSGIRSLISLFTVSVIFGYFFESTTRKRWILAVLSIPVAVAANAVRIFGTGLCVQYWDPDKATGFFHEFSGWLVFLVSLSLLYLAHISMHLRVWKRTVAQ